MNEYQIKLEISRIMNKNGGGNPYHDALGKFTNGPSGAFGKFSSKEKPGKWDFEKIGFVTLGGKFESALEKKEIDALVKIHQAMDNVYNHAADLEDKNGGISYSSFYEMTSDIGDRIKEFSNASRPNRGLKANEVQQLVARTKQTENKIKSMTDRFKSSNDKDIAEMSDATKAAINTFKYIQENNLANISTGQRPIKSYSIDDF